MSLDYELSYIKQHYREIFAQARKVIEERLGALQADYTCPGCPEPPAMLDTLHEGCGYRAWQTRMLDVLEKEVGREILERLDQINTYKKRFSCSMCGACCRLASSEFSYEQLQEKARHGDHFAKQFTSVFLPYASTQAAREKMPAVVDEITAQLKDSTEPVYFYHCPYVSEDNRCTIYGKPKRPALCESYPDTPLTFIHDQCAWKPWKDATHEDALYAHALIEIALFMAGKLREALSSSAGTSLPGGGA